MDDLQLAERASEDPGWSGEDGRGDGSPSVMEANGSAAVVHGCVAHRLGLTLSHKINLPSRDVNEKA